MTYRCRAEGSRSRGCREHSAIPRTWSLCLSRSSLPAGDTFNIPCMTSAVQPLSHIPQLASHHRSACKHTPHRGHVLAINSQAQLASESTGEFSLKCDGTVRPACPGISEVARLHIKKYFPYALQLSCVL